MRQDLFRQEALAFNRERLLGDILVNRPVSLSLFTMVSVVLVLVLISFVYWGQYTRKAHVSGYLAPTKGLIKVIASQTGTLIEKHVREGQHVKEGDALFTLSTERSSPTTAETQAAAIVELQRRRQSLRQELSKQLDIVAIQSRSTQERIHGVEAEMAQLGSEIKTQEQRVKSAEGTLARYRTLVAEKFVSEVQAQLKQDELLDQQGRLQNLQRSRLSLERDAKTLRGELAANEPKSANERAAVEREISALDQQLTEYEARRTVVITAPSDGTVTTILAERGQSVNASTLLLSILPPKAELEAQLFVPSRAVGFVATEQKVAVRYQAFPYQRFGSYKGRVVDISKTPIAPSEASLPISLQEPAYRVTVALDSQAVKAYQRDVPLQAGMLLEADIQLDHRRIIEWIFDPFYSVARRV